MNNTLIDIIDKPLLISQKVLQRVRTKLSSLKSKQTLVDSAKQTFLNQDLTKPNDSLSWEEVYLTEKIEPVKKIEDELALKILELTGEDDSLLEAGCGFGKISAQLGLGKRKIFLSDFSEKILNQAIELFRQSNIKLENSYVFDMTKKFPLGDEAIDTVWSSGVLEHWTDEELSPIVNEMVRVSRKSVISFVPYNGCTFYRMGKYIMEKQGRWPYGRELPRESQKEIFGKAGLVNISEKIMLKSWAPNLMWDIMPEKYTEIRDWWNSLPDDDIVKRNQGYLLATIGYKK